MSLAAKLRRAPGRVVTGAFILNSGIGKLKGDENTAAAVHGMAAGAYPFLGKVPPKPFLKGLAISETALGSALLLPIVPAKVAGAGLTGFSAGLLGMWWRTPGMHEGIRPTQQGTVIAKDVWMLGIGTSLLIDGVLGDAGDSHSVRKANRTARRAERKARRAERTAQQNDYKTAAQARRRELRAEAKASAKEHAQVLRAAAKSAAHERAKAARKASKNVAEAARPAAESALAATREAAESAAATTRAAAESAVAATRSAAESAADSATTSFHTLADRVNS
jgi:flagellar biosynthesis GTPase FlhF